MTNWKTVSDEIFLQALRNHCLRVWGSVPDAPQTVVQEAIVIHKGKEFYEAHPDWVEGLEEEIAKLLDN